MSEVTELFAFVVDGGDGNEGVAAVRTPQGWMPMIGADRARVESFRPHAQAIADATGRDVRLILFAFPELVETLRPVGGG